LELPAGNSLGAKNDLGFGAVGPLRNITNNPYEQSWSFGIERQLPYNIVLNTMYVGKKRHSSVFFWRQLHQPLGPEADSYTAAQINQLTTQVTNPLQGLVNDPTVPFIIQR